MTGNLAIAGAITLVESVVNTVAHDFFDRWWARRKRGAPQTDAQRLSVAT